MSWRFY